MINYEKYRLTRIVTVHEIVSADYVNGIHPSTNSHAHQDAWELCVCLEGEITVFRGEYQYTLHAGQLMFIPPELFHDISVHIKDSSCFVVSFTCANSDHMRLLQDSVISIDQSQLELVGNMIVELDSTFVRHQDMLHLYQFVPSAESPLGAEQMICCYLEQLLITLLRSATMEQGQIVRSRHFKEAMQARLVEQITQYIDDHLGDHLTVEDIAERFHYSRARLSTIYKQYTGFGINEMITHRRIREAKLLLLEQTKSVAQISETLGFSSPQYFSHKFTEIVGIPPSKYAQSIAHTAKE